MCSASYDPIDPLVVLGFLVGKSLIPLVTSFFAFIARLNARCFGNFSNCVAKPL